MAAINHHHQRTFRLNLTVEQLVAVGLNGQPVGNCLEVILLLLLTVPQAGVVGDETDGRGHRLTEPRNKGVVGQLLVVESHTRDHTLRLRFRLRKREAEAFRNITEDSATAGAIDPSEGLGDGVESECDGV